ncbi:MAG: ribosome-associated translation inhibitor RaiA [Lachnospiraceae bacterium]|nr:ribosome-associated translation inhibitor RaiA [Lachnospiraceae bacterium]
MRYTITGRNIDVTPGLREAIEEKIGKLDRYFNPDTEVIVTLSVQKDKQKIEVTIPVKGNIIRAEESSSDMYVSIDLVEEIIERQMKKYKKKLIDKKQSAQAFSSLFINEEDEPEEEIKIVKTKRFGIKPMDPEEACVQMELLGHDFYVFLNAETEEVNVVYKRKGHTYGLIEPEF